MIVIEVPEVEELIQSGVNDWSLPSASDPSLVAVITTVLDLRQGQISVVGQSAGEQPPLNCPLRRPPAPPLVVDGVSRPR